MRNVAAAGVPAAVLAVAWLLLEEPSRALWFVLGAGLGVVVGLHAGRGVRGLVLLACGLVLVACGVAGTLSPGEAFASVVRGARDAPVVHAPFDPGAHGALHALVVLAVFGLAALVSSSVATDRPLRAGIVGAAGIAWPVTLVDRGAVVWGCVALVVALWPSFVRRLSGVRALATGVAALVLLSAGTAAAGAAGLGADAARVDWKGWDPLGRTRARVGVRYVWDANYGGVQFPRRETVVLRISAPRRSLYWRASTLDLFARDRWLETLYAVRFGPAVGDLPVDPLAPPRIGTPVRQDVVVEALDDPRLVAASVPLRLEAPTLPQVLVSSGNVLSAPLGVPGGTRYTVWSSAPRPSPSALVRSRPRYPDDLRRYLDLGRTRMPPFGEEGRASVVSTILADEARYPDLVPYTPVWREARRLAGAARSPYLATLALERWLRTSGGYTYDERPPAPPSGVPALADFTVGAKRGYCQHYAGSMALMLRMLGVPARVAVGFTSGRFADGVWTVTDWNAHAWVEAWFDGYGWLPFDPTPGRGRFSSAYSFGSDSADAVRALGTGRLLDFSPQPTGPSTQPEQPTGPQPESGSRRPLWPLLIPALAALALVLVPGLKRRTRRTRLGAADPRERAAGIRLELAGRLGDHGIATASTASFGEIAHEAERQLGVSTRALVGHVLTARYAPPALARPAADAATHELDDVESAIRERVGTFQAWRAALRPRLRR